MDIISVCPCGEWKADDSERLLTGIDSNEDVVLKVWIWVKNWEYLILVHIPLKGSPFLGICNRHTFSYFSYEV